MISLFTFTTPEHECSYLPEQTASLRYEVVGSATAAEYQARLEAGWRRFGRSMFRHACPACSRCWSLRVPIGSFAPDRSQRRAWKANADVRLEIGDPEVTEEKLELFDRFHEYQSLVKDWPEQDAKEPEDYAKSFLDNPFPTEEWQYFVGERLVGVGYVDALPQGLSAIYFFYEPEERGRSLGTYNVLRILAGAATRQLPHVYLGYYVAGCRSLEYKARFRPTEVLGPAGDWEPFGG